MTVALVGVGSMGESLLAGWIAAGIAPESIATVNRRAERAVELQERYGTASIELADAGARDVVVLAVKPYQIRQIAAELAEHLTPRTVVVSVAAGVTLAQLAAELPAGQPIARIMPNTAARVATSATTVMFADGVTDEQRHRVIALCDAVGTTAEISEDHIHAAISVAGSAPAFLFYIAEALIEAGVAQGLPRDVATSLVEQTFLGASRLLCETSSSATELRHQVTSPGGTTASGLREMDERAVKAAIMATAEAAAKASQRLSASGT